MTEGAYFREEPLPSGATEKAAVFQTEDPTKVEDNPELSRALSEVGLRADEFRQLISGNFEDAEPAYDENLTANGITEKVHVRVAKLGGRVIEVSECLRSEDSKTPPVAFDLQIRGKDSHFKIAVGLAGEGVLRLPKVEPAGHLYAAGGEFEDVPLRAGTVAVIQAPTAWSFESSKAGLKYLYLSSPRWQEGVDQTAENTIESDESKVKHYQSLLRSQEDEGRIARENSSPSYAFVAKDWSKEILTYGFHHVSQSEKYTEVVEALDSFKPQLLLVEGGGDWSTSFGNRTADQVMRKFGEQAYMTYLAKERGIEVRTWDLNGNEQFLAAVRKNSPDAVVGWEIGAIVGQLYRYDRPRTIDNFIDEAGLSERRRIFAEKYGVDFSPENIERVAKKYTGHTVEEMTQREADGLCNPFGTSEGNKVARDMTNPRDEKAIEVLAAAKEKYDRVMATCGRNHAIRWEPAIATMYGNAERV